MPAGERGAYRGADERVNIPPLAIIQARYNSARFPGKMLALIDGMSIIERVWRSCCVAFGKEHVVIAHPDNEAQAPLVSHIDAMMAQRFAYAGPENDVLGRFYAVAHAYRWHPESVIMRITPDDPWKHPELMRRVAAGERLPVELGGEAFTLAQLDRVGIEHLTYAFFPGNPAPPTPPGIWSIDTPEQLADAMAPEAKEARAYALTRFGILSPERDGRRQVGMVPEGYQ